MRKFTEEEIKNGITNISDKNLANIIMEFAKKFFELTNYIHKKRKFMDR